MTAKQALGQAEAVWNPKRWKRGAPKAGAIRAHRNAVRCAAGPGHRKAIKRRWSYLQAAYFKHRQDMFWRQRVTPFHGCTPYGNCGWYALPIPLVICESGGNYSFPYGAYSILDAAWRAWGGKTEHAGEASKREQDLVAHHGWMLYGEGAWECKSDGSTSWP